MTTFSDLGLSQVLLSSIQEMGFEYPTEIQAAVIPKILEGNQDIIALAQTGSGKTAAFSLPILEKMSFGAKSPSMLVLAPTRELAIQIETEIRRYATKISDLRTAIIYGGSSYGLQKKALRGGVDLVVATPGRLLDLAKGEHIDLSRVEYLVLDEADTMLNMGFKEELEAILELLPPERQNLLFSATMPHWISNLAQGTLQEPLQITVGTKNAGAASVEHRFYMVKAHDKLEALTRLVDSLPEIYAIIFVRTRQSAKEVAEKLAKKAYPVDALHGDLSQDQREYVTRKFRERSLQLLVATDIAARGLDVKGLTHVIHFDLPDEVENYTHRSGRTGRAGESGHSLALINLRERQKIKRLERSLKLPIKADKIPSGEDICNAQVMKLAELIHKEDYDMEELEGLYRMVRSKWEELDREELIRRFLSLQFKTLLETYRKARDLNVSDRRPQTRDDFGKTRISGRGKRNQERDSRDLVWLSINLGKQDNLAPGDLINLINRTFPRTNIEIGAIRIDWSGTRFQVDPEGAALIVSGLKRQKVFDKRLKVKEAPTRAGGKDRKGSSKSSFNRKRRS